MRDAVNILVPAEVAEEVRRFADFVIADRAVVSTNYPSADRDDVPDYPLWGDEHVIALANASTTTAVNYRKIMNAIISHDAVGAWVPIVDLATWTGEKVSAIANFRTHLYRWINAYLPAGSSAPFSARRGDKLHPPRGREVHYRVSAECASQWARVQEKLAEI